MKEPTVEQRREIIADIVTQHVTGFETLGTAIRRLRLEVTGLDQETFAVMCKMSTKALYQIEKDKGNPTINTLECILRTFGLRLGLAKAATSIYAPPPQKRKADPKTPVRGANPRRKTAAQLGSVVTKTKDGGKAD